MTNLHQFNYPLSWVDNNVDRYNSTDKNIEQKQSYEYTIQMYGDNDIISHQYCHHTLHLNLLPHLNIIIILSINMQKNGRNMYQQARVTWQSVSDLRLVTAFMVEHTWVMFWKLQILCVSKRHYENGLLVHNLANVFFPESMVTACAENC